MFPYGGQAVLRSSWRSNATWAWFDVGPYGSSPHGHRDKLGLVVRGFGGSFFLTDSGRFAYAGNSTSALLYPYGYVPFQLNYPPFRLF